MWGAGRYWGIHLSTINHLLNMHPGPTTVFVRHSKMNGKLSVPKLPVHNFFAHGIPVRKRPGVKERWEEWNQWLLWKPRASWVGQGVFLGGVNICRHKSVLKGRDATIAGNVQKWGRHYKEGKNCADSKEQVEIRCSEESSEGPESRGGSLVIQCLGNKNNRNQYNQRE